MAYHQRPVTDTDVGGDAGAAKGAGGGAKGGQDAEPLPSCRADHRLSMVAWSAEPDRPFDAATADGSSGADGDGSGNVPPCSGDFVDLSQRVETVLMDLDPLYIPLAEVRAGGRRGDGGEGGGGVGAGPGGFGRLSSAGGGAPAAAPAFPTARVSRLRALLTGDINRDGRVTEEERRTCFRGTAAAGALVGMAIALGLLTRDYVRSQAAPAVLLGYTHEGGDRPLPALTACSGVADLPAFATFPTADYPGLPLFSVATRGGGGEEGNRGAAAVAASTVPEAATGGGHCAERLSRLSPALLATAAAAQSAGDVLDTLPSGRLEGGPGGAVGAATPLTTPPATADAPTTAATDGGPCFACLTLGASLPLLVSSPTSPDARGAAASLVSIEVTTSRLWGVCRGLVDARPSVARAVMVAEVARHGAALVARGTLSIPADAPPLRDVLTLPRSAGAAAAASTTAVLCNTYFFAGYFYPAAPADVRYTLVASAAEGGEAGANGTADASSGWTWRRTGDGPYYEPPAAATEGAPRWSQAGVELFARPHVVVASGSPAGSDGGSGDGGGGGGDGSLPPLVPAHRVAVLDAGTHSRVLFTRREGPPGIARAAYPARVVATPLGGASAGTVGHPLSVGYASAWAEQLTATPTMSTMEFGTDVLEYVSLFTGFCFYSVVAWPLTLAVRRRQQGAAGRGAG